MKKGYIKAGLIGFFCLFFLGVVLFSFFSSAYSNEEKTVENYTVFNFETGNTYLINTTLKFNLDKLGNYELMIVNPSEEKIFRVGSNDMFSFNLLEAGNYSVSLKRGNGKVFYEFFVKADNSTDNSTSPTPIKGELVQEKAEINKPVAWTLMVNDTLIEIPNSTNLTLTKEDGKPFLDYNLTQIDGKNYVQIEENLSEEVKLEYVTEPPKVEEKNISGNLKEVVVSSPEDVHYEDVLAYTTIPEKLQLGQENLIKIYWKEEDKYLGFQVKDTNNNGLIDYVEWTVPHLSEQTFQIIFITKAEHLSSNKTFISDIYEQVKALDDIWSETIPDGDYVRVTFENPLSSLRDITLYSELFQETQQ
jgi:hypothetical protein